VFLAYPSTSTTATSRAARLLIGAMLDEASGAVRNELAASYGVSGKYSYDAAGGTYIVRGLVDAARVGEALTLLRTRIAALGDGSDLAKRTFAVARRKAALAASGDPTSSADLASVLVGATEMGLSPQQAGELPAEIAKLTYPDIVPYLAAELVPSQEVISLAGPKAAVTAAFVALKITPIWR
jgi:predicted Zn-dependent peptidase